MGFRFQRERIAQTLDANTNALRATCEANQLDNKVLVASWRDCVIVVAFTQQLLSVLTLITFTGAKRVCVS